MRPIEGSLDLYGTSKGPFSTGSTPRRDEGALSTGKSDATPTPKRASLLRRRGKNKEEGKLCLVRKICECPKAKETFFSRPAIKKLVLELTFY